jgi:hypothetical protein
MPGLYLGDAEVTGVRLGAREVTAVYRGAELLWSKPTGGDGTPPNGPATVTATATSSSTVDVSWPAATDDVGVVGYRVRRGTQTIAASVPGLSFTDTGLAAGSTHTYSVSAVDAAGNYSLGATSEPVTLPAAPTATPVFRAASTGAQQAAADTSLTAPVPVGTQAGDLMLLVMRTNRFLDTQANVGTPAGWTRAATNSSYAGTAGHALLFTRRAQSADLGGTVTVPILNGDASARTATILAYSSAAGISGVTWGGSGTAATSLDAPTTTGVANGRLLCAWMQGGDTFIGGSGTTPPVSMTERVDFHGDYHNGIAAADEPITADGPTGVRAAARGTSYPYVSLTLVIQPATAEPNWIAAGTWTGTDPWAAHS